MVLGERKSSSQSLTLPAPHKRRITLTTIKQPTPEQVKALRSFANAHGRTWKSHLNHVWMTGNYGFADDSMSLQQVRNSFGPAWLARFKLLRAESV